MIEQVAMNQKIYISSFDQDSFLFRLGVIKEPQPWTYGKTSKLHNKLNIVRSDASRTNGSELEIP